MFNTGAASRWTGAFIAMVAAGTADAADLTIEFSLKAAGNGQVFVSVYSSAADWMKKPVKSLKIAPTGDAATAVVADLPPGDYAVSAFHDSNGNGKLDANFLKIPNEPYGFSNNASGSFGPPSFDQAKFVLGTTDLKIAIALR